jgi:hypothetical protein
VVLVEPPNGSPGFHERATLVFLQLTQGMEIVNVERAAGRDDFHVVRIIFRSKNRTTWKSSLPPTFNVDRPNAFHEIEYKAAVPNGAIWRYRFSTNGTTLPVSVSFVVDRKTGEARFENAGR